MRTPNNPYYRQIERDENRQMIRELAKSLLCVLVALLLVWGFFRLVLPADLPTGTIVEDSRGMELKRLYDQALKGGD